MTERPDAGASTIGLRRELDALTLDVFSRVTEAPVNGLDRVLQDVLVQLGSVLGVDRITVLSLTDDRRGLRVRRTWSAPRVPPLPILRAQDELSELVAKALRGEIVEVRGVEDRHGHTPRDLASLHELGQRSLLALPLRFGGVSVGALWLGGVLRAYAWTDELVAGLQSFGQAMAMALHRQQEAQARVQHDEALRETERLAGLGHWTHHYALGTTVASAELHAIFQLDPRVELEPTSMVAKIHPQDRATYEAFLAVLLVGRTPAPIEVRVVHRNGELRHVRCWGAAGRDQDGSLTFARGVVLDVTERKHYEVALVALNHRLVRAHEEERARLAREIHDDLGQRLAVLKLELDLVCRDASLAAPVAERLAAASRSTAEVATAVRGLSHGLHPGVLERLGLCGSLAALCRQTHAPGKLAVRFVGPEVGPPPLAPEVSLGLYRVAQEALANARRHSRAHEVVVRLALADAQLRLEVRDDGVGMAMRGGAGMHGLGLLGMRERMHLVGGRLEVTSAPGEGTRIEATVPLARGDEP
jgi:signal transduction histidine kinase